MHNTETTGLRELKKKKNEDMKLEEKYIVEWRSKVMNKIHGIHVYVCMKFSKYKYNLSFKISNVG